ncbi:M14 family metallopeptidase [Pseudomonas sp. J452]|uniref:M14 family metallopeptidase n=1 Tax=Pseudomonas sp. J452 TaxID=2898441 RepID=UPI0021AD575F|nr:M14 family metallopeptidase [Pseudomonas sp. J452]UUY09795.1 M14 family metallopeptidase [Pseudomonas sp. J452]
MDLSCFSQSYAEARQKFLDASAAAGLLVESHIHPLQGRDGEELALDVARLGAPDATNLLILSSACHGVEGFCGSGLQIDRLRDSAWIERCKRDDLAVLFLHALNPYGFSWLRRVTEDNVDLNRNFIDFSQPLPDNPDYRAIAHLLLPRQQPPTLRSTLGLLGYALRHGRMALQGAISRGQHSDATGLFFAGSAPTWSNQTLRQVLRQHGRQCQRIGWVDVHTGLGPRGVGERIYKGQQVAADIARARRWWGAGVTNSAEGNSVSARLNGTIELVVMQTCPQAEYNGLTLEYGTLPGLKVLNALRAEHWLQRNPQVPAAQSGRIKRQLRDAFYVDADDWKQQVLAQGREVLEQTLAGLASPLTD